MLGSWGIILIKMETARVMVQDTQIYVPLTGSELGAMDTIPTTCRLLECMSLTTSTHQLFLLPNQSYPLFSPASPPETSVNILMQRVPFLTSSRISRAHSPVDREPQLPGPTVTRHNLRVTALSSKLKNPLVPSLLDFPRQSFHTFSSEVFDSTQTSQQCTTL